MVKIMSKLKEDSWENILKKRFSESIYESFRKFYTDDFLEKEYNHWKKDFGLSKETFIESYTSPSGEWLYAPNLPNYMSKNREWVITETDLPPAEIAIIGEYLSETSDSL